MKKNPTAVPISEPTNSNLRPTESIKNIVIKVAPNGITATNKVGSTGDSNFECVENSAV